MHLKKSCPKESRAALFCSINLKLYGFYKW
nr:MAG TPA: hypothetical protein [Caudoviricetes sp.]